MNNHIINKTTYNKKYNLPIYLDYMLISVIKSFPFSCSYSCLNTNINKIIQILNYVDQSNIHPIIFKPLFINIIHSLFINQIIIYKNSSIIKTDNFDYSSLTNVDFEISLLFDQFDKIFDNIDIKYLNKEIEIDYNNMSSLDEQSFNSLFSSIAINPYQAFSDKKVLNTFIIYLQRFSQIEVENLIKSINIDCNDILNFKQINILSKSNETNETNETNKSNETNETKENYDYKLNFDYELLQFLINNYSNIIKQKYLQTKFFDIFEHINIFDKLNEINNNILYFWIDYMAIINNLLFEKLLKV
jgi:hypothetical protein